MDEEKLDIVFCADSYSERVNYAFLLDKDDYDVIWSDGTEILATFDTLKNERDKIAKLMRKYLEVNQYG